MDSFTPTCTVMGHIDHCHTDAALKLGSHIISAVSAPVFPLAGVWNILEMRE